MGHTVLKNHGHGGTFVKNPQFPLGALLVCRVGEDASVQQCPVGVCHHTSDIPSAIRFAVLLNGILQAVEILLHRLFPVQAVSLVDAVNGAGLGEPHVRVREDEFAQGVVHGEAVDGATLHGDDELGTGAIHGESTSHQLTPGHKQFFLLALAALFELEDAKDCPDAHPGIQIATPINWIADHRISRLGVLVENYTLFFLFADQQSAFPRRTHGGHKEIVTYDVEFLLIIARGVGGARQACEVDEGGAANVVGYGFKRELEGMAEEAEAVDGLAIGLCRRGKRNV